MSVPDLFPDVYRRLLTLNREVEAARRSADVELAVIELVKVRASQINGCAFCTDMHAKEALEAGVTARQLAVLPTWRETRLFTSAERAALDLAESMSRLALTQHVPDEVYAAAAEVFDEDQLAVVIWAAAVIQTFNALNVTCPKPLPEQDWPS
ncbi:carboxymuconolactone decarboxylase family protein [Occultella glacieicola]|uniref:Carboxymuconolactone decarboxylase family protein n=1 Tax=Occultella glacieicola TaxID=2518684 RepID=A0ABY2E2K3_9MICO|nr:carboxymuconolactone decarboxylase family protein [Occultella glacieicola]